MPKVKDYLAGFITESVALVIGWLYCIAILAGAYSLGRWAAPHLGWYGTPDTLGLLSAITFVWMYERRSIDIRYDRLRELLER